MLSLETASVWELPKHQEEYETKVRRSLLQAATVPYDGDVRAEPISKSSTMHRARIKGLTKFEIILNKRTPPEELEKVIELFRIDSLDSMKRGGPQPSLKDYIDIYSDSYEAGEDVSGYVSLTISKKLDICDIKMKVKGTYIVAYQMKQEGEEISSTEQLTFFDDNKDLMVKASNQSSAPHMPGDYKYDFSFRLPRNIPGTLFYERFITVYEGASVVYSIEAVIEMEENGQRVLSPLVKEVFNVIVRIPERFEQLYYQPHMINKTKNLTFCCFGMGSIYIAASLKQLIYKEGDVIIVELLLSNNSRAKITDIDLALLQHNSFLNKDLTGYALTVKSTLLSHKISLDSLGVGDISHELALLLPDSMQPSTAINKIPGSGQQNVRLTASEPVPRAHLKDEKSSEPVSIKDVWIDEKISKKDSEDAVLLDQNYNMLYDIAYYVQVQVVTSGAWSGMKGPEITFPITVEIADSLTRKTRQESRYAKSNYEEVKDVIVIEETEFAEPFILPE